MKPTDSKDCTQFNIKNYWIKQLLKTNDVIQTHVITLVLQWSVHKLCRCCLVPKGPNGMTSHGKCQEKIISNGRNQSLSGIDVICLWPTRRGCPCETQGRRIFADGSDSILFGIEDKDNVAFVEGSIICVLAKFSVHRHRSTLSSNDILNISAPPLVCAKHLPSSKQSGTW